MKRIVLNLMLLLIGSGLMAQTEGVGINPTGNDPDASAMLDVQSDSKGFLLPRMTTGERNQIKNPAEGLYIYNLDDSCFNYFTGKIWIKDCGLTSDLDAVPVGFQGGGIFARVQEISEAPENTLYIGGTFRDQVTLGSITLTNPGNTGYLARYNPETGEYLWANTFLTGTSIPEIRKMSTDENGNLYAMGPISSGLAIGGTPVGFSGSYLAKVDPSGNITWIFEADGGAEMNDIQAVPGGGVYFTGVIISSSNFGGTVITPAATRDIFLGKLTDTGNLDFVNNGYVTVAGASAPRVSSLNIDSQGEILITGGVVGTYVFGGTTLTDGGSILPFLAKFDASGNPLWARSFDQTETSLNISSVYDGNDNLFIAGIYSDSIVMGATTLTPVNGNQDMYLAKLDPTGNTLWARTFGSATNQAFPSLQASSNGNVFIAGTFQAPLLVEGQTLTPANEDIFVIQYTAEGTKGWTAQAQGGGKESLGDLTYTSNGRLYAGGAFNSTPATFGDVELSATSSFDSGFIWPLDELTGKDAIKSGLSSTQDNDRDASNEIQSLNLNGNQLSITGGNAVTLPADGDGDPNNEIQSLNLNGNQLSITGGNAITLPADGDGDPTNELQDWTTLPNIPSDFADNVDDVIDADADSTNELQTLEEVLIKGNDANAQPIMNLSELEVKGSITMQDGNQAEGFLMTSDENGKGSWQSVSGLIAPTVPLDFSCINELNSISVGGNSFLNFVISGNYAYVIRGTLFLVYDISDPANLNLVGSTAANNPNPTSMAISDSYVYIVDEGVDELWIFDISNPTTPALAGTLAIGPEPTGITVSGNYAYVTDRGSDDLKVIDVSNTANPSVVGSLAIGPDPTAITVSGNYAYVTDRGSDDLKVIDVSNTANPSVVGSLAIGPDPTAITVYGNYAYVTDNSSDDLKVINIMTPNSPSLTGSIAMGPNPVDIAVQNNNAYVIDGSSEALTVVDLRNPASPAIVGNLGGFNSPYLIKVSGNYGYVVENFTKELISIELACTEEVAVALDPITGTLVSGNGPQNLGEVLSQGNDANAQSITNLSGLEVNGSISMQDGTQQEDYVLTSDANGTANWQQGGSVLQGTGGNVYNLQARRALGSTGNTKGEYSVDLQTFRNGAGFIAAGQLSTIGGGRNNTASGANTTIGGGFFNQAAGNASTIAGGTGNQALESGASIGGGFNNIAAGWNSTVPGGSGIEVYSYGEIGLGYFNVIDTPALASGPMPLDPLLVVGNGSPTQRSNALTLLKNGRLGLGTSSPANTLHIVGNQPATQGVATIQNTNQSGFAGTYYNDYQGTRVGYIGWVNSTANNLLGAGTLQMGAGGATIYLNPTTGNIGVGGNNTNKAKLEVLGSVAYDPFNIGFLNAAGNIGSYDPNFTFPYSIYASGVIGSLEFHAHSDQRIKKIQGISNSETDLHTLMQIEVTDYRLRDSITNGNRPIKKVIAQQVAEVYPQAVNTDLTEVVPDIYQRAEVQDGWIMLATDLQPGERVKLISEEGNRVYTVIGVEEGRFQVSDLASDFSQPSGLASQVFVYGREVDDFHTVDYEAISMLNVSATQEQQRRIEALEAENATKQAEIASLRAKVEQLQGLEARLQALEALLPPTATQAKVSPR